MHNQGRFNTVVCFDSEGTSLKADTGILFAYGFLQVDKCDVDFLGDGEIDASEKKLIERCLGHFPQQKTVLTWSGNGYDMPFVTTRAFKYGLDPKPLLQQNHIDLWEVASQHLNLTRYRLEDVARFFNIERQSPLSGKDVPILCLKAAQGDKTALEQVIVHLKDDLQTLAKVYEKIKSLTWW